MAPEHRRRVTSARPGIPSFLFADYALSISPGTRSLQPIIFVVRQLEKLGIDVSRTSSPRHALARRSMLLDRLGIDLVLDVGANEGQYAKRLRTGANYSGRIASFEPLADPFLRLKEGSRHDPLWDVYNVGLGQRAGLLPMNVAMNSVSSSVLGMLPRHIDAAPGSAYVGTEMVRFSTLDSLFMDVCGSAEAIFLKIDVQGLELEVLRGATQSLDRIATIQLEVSLVPLYAGQPTFRDVYGCVSDLGYNLIGVEPGFTDPGSGMLLQMDGIFHRGVGVATTRGL